MARRTAVRKRWRAGLSSTCAAIAVAWWAISATRGHNQIYNPGPVSLAHSMWENDCARCHDNDGKGGFRAAVSDGACLGCHDASAHSPKQLLRAGLNAHNPLAMAIADNHGRLRSADCVACHAEHRGRRALAVVDDARCTKCHADLKSAVKSDASLEVSTQVTRFDSVGGHPYFGRNWATIEQRRQPPAPLNNDVFVDPTRLKFNHKVHTREVKPLTGETDNCTVCHTDRDPANPAQINRYMRPISYVENCQSCHPLNLPSGVPVAHAGMDVVEAQLQSLPELHRQWIVRSPEPQRGKLLQGHSPQVWADNEASRVQQSVGDWLLEMSPKNARGAEQVARVIQEFLPGDEKAGSDPRALALYVAFGAHDQAKVKSASCAKCHDMEDVAASISSGTASTQPAVPVLRTLPTGIPPTPRRWFEHSRFDHAAHENISCVSCHSTAASSEKTSDFLVPNLIWRESTGASVSCAQCHHELDAAGRGAPSHCVTCHTFHDMKESTTTVRKQGVMAILGAEQQEAPKVATEAVVRFPQAR
jgi:hypothetical protein